MPIGDLIYNADLAHLYGCTCGNSTSGTTSTDADKTCNCNTVNYLMPPPPPAIDVCRYPYPPYPYPYPAPVPPEADSIKQNATEKAICKLSKKAAAIRQLIENLETKNKPLIVKSGAASFNLGAFKTPDPEDATLEIENENIQSVIDILKVELEKIKEEIKELSDKLVED